MRRLCVVCVLLCAAFIGAGCASDGEKHWYSNALDDLNGKNMQMHGPGFGDSEKK